MRDGCCVETPEPLVRLAAQRKLSLSGHSIDNVLVYVGTTPMQIQFLLRAASRIFPAVTGVVLLCTLPVHAQQQSNAGFEALAAAPVSEQITLKNDRLFYVMANYTTVEHADEFRALSAKTKFKLSAKTMSDPVTVSFIGMMALMGQARNNDPSYGQGLQGYVKRYGTSFADTGIGTLMTTSVFPTVLHQDPRYFQLGTGSTWHRAKYAVSRILVTRTDNGEVQFNYSEIVGNAVAAGISNTYHPQSQRTLGNTLSVWGTDVLLNTACNVAKEFWPDIRGKIHKQKHSE